MTDRWLGAALWLVAAAGALAPQGAVPPPPAPAAVPPPPAPAAVLPPPAPAAVLAPGLSRAAGVDASSGLTWTRIFLEGRTIGAEEKVPPPTLTAQCTAKDGKMRFEVYANLGKVTDRDFHSPWRPSPGDLYAPNYEKAAVTMEFLGYTRVKPVKRQWELLTVPFGEMRYNTPSVASSNMEDISFYLRYLLALPTLRLTVPGKGTAEFETAAWLTQLKKENICRASGL